MAQVLTSDVTARTTFAIVQCYRCGVLFGLPAEFEAQRRSDKESWSCPNGHAQNFVGKSDRLRCMDAELELDIVRGENERLSRANDRLRKKVQSKPKAKAKPK